MSVAMPKVGERWAVRDIDSEAALDHGFVCRVFNVSSEMVSVVFPVTSGDEPLAEGGAYAWPSHRDFLREFVPFPTISAGTKYHAREDFSKVVVVVADNNKGISYSPQGQPDKYFKSQPRDFWRLFEPHHETKVRDIWERLMEDMD